MPVLPVSRHHWSFLAARKNTSDLCLSTRESAAGSENAPFINNVILIPSPIDKAQRNAGSRVVLINGQLAAWIGRGDRQLVVSLPADEPEDA